MLISNRYQQGTQIGEGAMGVVYRGIDNHTNQPIVLKKLKPDIADADMIARFLREGEALRQLNHPNIVKMLDAVEEGKQYYLILELVPGGNLREMMDRQPKLPLDRVLNIGVELSDALTRAHHLKIVHRDLKPANILIAQDGTPRLTDFGIARVGASNLTEHGAITGTFAYIPPEGFQGLQPTPLFDIWAFGVVLFEMLTGRLPFPQQTLTALFKAVTQEPITRIEELRPDAPLALIDLINRMLEKDPRSRIPSVRLVGAELEAIMLNINSISDVTDTDHTVIVDSRFKTATPITKSRHNLPMQTTPFVGREAELSELEQLLTESRLVTLLAQGGMGKTRLSLEVAGRFAGIHRDTTSPHVFLDGVYFVELAPISDPMGIISAIAEAVNYPFQADQRTPRQQLHDYFSEKHQLLILDNFEHVLDGAELVNDLLQFAPNLHILITSRTKLNLGGERLFNLEAMDFPRWETPADAMNYSAVKLFMQSAVRVQPTFQLQADDLPYIARICRMVEGLPLGILLAAGWLDVLSVREIADEIAKSLNFLETDRRDFPERQRSIRAVFDYSWNLLTPAERDVFMQLTVFRGSFAREAAQSVSKADLRVLQGLVNKSLLRRNIISGRFEIHELLRQYAHQRLEESGRVAEVNSAHSRYFLDLLAKQTPNLKGHGQLNALNLIEADFDNVRAAWEWGANQRDAAGISGALEAVELFTTFRSRITEGKHLLRVARGVWADQSPLAGKLAVRYPDDPVLEQLRRGLAIAEQHGDLPEIAYCKRVIGHWLSHTLFDHPKGIPAIQESITLFRQLQHNYYTALALDDLGWSYNLTGEKERQLEVIEQSIDIRRQIGDKIGMANSLRNMGGASGGFDGRTGGSLDYWEQAKALASEMGDRLGVLWNNSLIAASYLAFGDFEQSHRYVDEALPVAIELNDPVLKGFLLIVQAILVLVEERDVVKGQQLLEQGFPPGTMPDFRFSMLTVGYGIFAAEINDMSVLDDMGRNFAEVFGGFLRTRPDYTISTMMPVFAVVLAQRGELQLATEVLSARLHYPHGGWVHRWERIKELQVELKAALGEDAYEKAWEAGKHADIELFSKMVVHNIISK